MEASWAWGSIWIAYCSRVESVLDFLLIHDDGEVDLSQYSGSFVMEFESLLPAAVRWWGQVGAIWSFRRWLNFQICLKYIKVEAAFETQVCWVCASGIYELLVVVAPVEVSGGVGYRRGRERWGTESGERKVGIILVIGRQLASVCG